MTRILLFYNARLVDETRDEPGALLVVDNKIRALYSGYFTNKKTLQTFVDAIIVEDGYEHCEVEYYDAKGLTLMPAFIDMHCHLRYPGQTEKEDLESGLKAAAAGGFGTVVAMPNTKPVVSSKTQVMEIVSKAASLGLVNLIQAVSITKDFSGNNLDHFFELDSTLTPIISEDGNDVENARFMYIAMVGAAERNLIVSCHCEDKEIAVMAKHERQDALALMKKNNLSSWNFTNDDEGSVSDETLDEIGETFARANKYLRIAENIATERNIALAKNAGCHIHIAHVSTSIALEAIRNAKELIAQNKAIQFDLDASAQYETMLDGETNENFSDTEESLDIVNANFEITCEVTPHHLALVSSDEPFNRTIVNPPLRNETDRLALIEGIRDGTIDVIATDHAPHTAEDKDAGAAGFSGFETAFAVCNTVLVSGGHISLQALSRLMSAEPARILHLHKGRLSPGYDADLVFVDSEEKITVDSSRFFSKGKANLFNGMQLTGTVKQVFVAGRKVF